jgi:acetyl esterase/lipase
LTTIKNRPLRGIFLLLSVGLLVCVGVRNAPAQMPSPADFAMTPIPTPDQPDAIRLYPGTAPGSEKATQKEQWESLPHDRVARNVTQPTLTPILPAKGKANGAAVIVAPGGGFMVLSMDNEGYLVAHWLADHGISAFVLKYRLNPTPAGEKEMTELGNRMFLAPPGPPGAKRPPPPTNELAVADAQEALRLVRRRAVEWGVDPKRIGMVGFSAGAMTVLQVALKNAPDARPEFVAPIYGPMDTVVVPPNPPALFVAHAADDPLLGLESFGLVEAWHKAGGSVELHIYEHGGHGFASSHRGTTSDLWIDQFYAWMQDRGFLGSAAKAPGDSAR